MPGVEWGERGGGAVVIQQRFMREGSCRGPTPNPFHIPSLHLSSTAVTALYFSRLFHSPRMYLVALLGLSAD